MKENPPVYFLRADYELLRKDSKSGLPVKSSPQTSAFSLIEVLLVVAVIAILSIGAIPAFNAIRGGQDLKKTAGDLSGLLEQARSHAMAKNTYVYVGIAEVDEDKESITILSDGGKLAVAIMASKIGIRPTASGEYSQIARVYKFNNVTLQSIASNSGNLERESGALDISVQDAATSFQFFFPQSNATFTKVIEFNPQGMARYTGPAAIDAWLEIPLQPKYGGTNNVAVLQVDGITGSVRTYRP